MVEEVMEEVLQGIIMNETMEIIIKGINQRNK